MLNLAAISNKPLSLPFGAQAIYSTRRVNGWNGKCCNVKRASDNATLDIGFNAADFIDMAAVIAFRGVSTLTVLTWYDQSGSGNDATGTTAILRQENLMGSLYPISCIPASGNAGVGTFTIPAGVSVSRQAYTAIAVYGVGGGVANSWGHFALGTDATATNNVSILYDNTAGSQAAEYWLDTGFINTNRKSFAVPIGIPTCTTIKSDASTVTFRVNGNQTTHAAAAAITLTGGYIGRGAYSSALQGTCDFFLLAIYGSTLSATQVLQAEANIASAYGTIQSINKPGLVCFDGDSITCGLNNSGFLLNLLRQTYPLVQNSYFYLDIGVAGQTMNTINTNRASATARFDSTLKKNISHIWGGTNDIEGRASGSIVGYASTVWTTYLLPYIQALQAAGFSVVVGTMLPRSWTGSGTDISQKETERLSYNSLITSNAAGNSYVVADYANISQWASSPSTYTGTYSVDGIHPTVAGYGLLAPVCAAALAAA
jgi:lysophospholipase L1-like esterase